MIPEASIAHSSAGRLRIKILSQRGNLDALKSSGDQIAACPGILSIEVNPVTGSMLLLHQTTVREIAEYARSKGIFSVLEQKDSRVPSANVRQTVGETFKRFDGQIQSLTDGEMDLRGVVGAGLIVAGTAQILTGGAAAIPWSAAYWYAYHLFSKTTEGEKK